LYSHQMVQGT